MMVLDHLKNKGFDNTSLSQVFAPIGLDIGAETPEEIAVSVVAELIQTKNQHGSGQNLSRQQAVNSGTPHRHSPDHHKILFG